MMDRELTPEQAFEAALGPSVRKGDLADVPVSRTGAKPLMDPDDAFLGSEKAPRKKPANLNPMTVREFEKSGWVYAKAQSYNAYSGRSSDLFGFLDFIALAPGRVIGVQVSTHSAAQPHFNKARKLPALKAWLATGAEFEIWGWHKPDRFWVLVRRIVALGTDGEPAVKEITTRLPREDLQTTLL